MLPARLSRKLAHLSLNLVPIPIIGIVAYYIFQEDVLSHIRVSAARLLIEVRRILGCCPPPKFFINSSNHRQWMTRKLEQSGWQEGTPADSTFIWHLEKRILPKVFSPVFNGLPNLLLLDDKAVLALITRRFTRTRPLVTHILYGEWDDARVSALRERWADPACNEPQWWIIKDAHASNGFSAAIFDRSVRPIVKKDVPGGYCYVVQEYVERPLLIDGRKFELRQYVLIRGDGSAYTYNRALIRLACVPYNPSSKDPRVHITNKYVQTGWESCSSEGRVLEDIELVSRDWPPYASLLDSEITPLIADLADAIVPLVSVSPTSRDNGKSGLTDQTDRSGHFELFACDLVVTESGKVHLMEININCAFGKFHPRTQKGLIRPLFEDLMSLCVLPAARNVRAAPGGWCRVRCGNGALQPETSVATKELQEHQMYVAFKKSSKKKYERQFVSQEFVLSDLARDETPKEEGKCVTCGYFTCVCHRRAC
ncbi:MAG: hypothetical protein SGPRY_006429 [Prymnesium sp.]